MKKVDQIILGLFYVYVFMLPMDNFMDAVFGINNPYRPHRLLCLVIGLLILVARRFSAIRFYSNDLKLLGVYIFGLIPTVIALLNDRLNVGYFWSTSLQYFIVLWILLLVKNLPFEMKHIYRCVFIFSVGALFNCLIMIYQFLYLDLGRQSGWTDNANYAAFSGIISFTFFFYYFVRSPERISSLKWIGFGLASCVLILGLFITGSRGAIISLVMVVLFLLFFQVSVSRRISNSILLVLTVMIIFISFGSSKVIELLPAWSRLTTLQDKEDSRMTLWRQGFEAFRATDYMGLGIEQFKNPDNYAKYVKKSENLNVINQQGLVLHNDFLAVLFEYGIISFILFVSFFYTLFKRLQKQSASVENRVLFYGIFIHMVWYSIFLSNFQTHAMWFVYIILGLVAYYNSREEKVVT